MSSISLEGGKTIEVDENDFMVDKNLQKVAMAGWIRSVMKSEGNCPSPLNIEPNKAESISLPPLEWYNYDEKAKIMKIKNIGNTVLLKGEWEKERPFLTGGPLRGCYVFSQAHFHWGPTDEEGSEHSFMGKRFSMEMHAVFFKAIYRNQKSALQNKDGIANLAYFFKLDENDNDHLQPLLQLIPEICKPNSIQEVQPLSLAELGIKDFKNNYYFYYGSTDLDEAALPVMWFIWPIPSPISRTQVDLFRNILSSSGEFVRGNFKSPLPMERGKNIFYVSDEPEDGESEKEVRAITADSESGKKTEPVVSKTLRKKRAGPLNTFLSFFSKIKKGSKRKTKWRLLSCCRRERRKEYESRKDNHLKPIKPKDIKEPKAEYVENLEEDILTIVSENEGFLKEWEDREDDDVKIVYPLPSKEENVTLISAEDHAESNSENVGNRVHSPKEINKESVENDSEVMETSKIRKNLRFDERVRVIDIDNDIGIHGDDTHKGIYVNIYKLHDRLDEDDAKKPPAFTARSSLKVNANNVDEAQISRLAKEEKEENESHEPLCETCKESKLENRIWIEEYHSKKEISWHVCEPDEKGRKEVPMRAEKAGRVEELENNEDRFERKTKDVLNTQVGTNSDENSGDETVVQKVKASHGGRRPRKRVPELQKILEMCRTNPDELLCVTVCIRDPRRLEIKRRQIQRKYYIRRYSRGRGRFSNLPLLPNLEKMPVIPEED